MGPSATADFYAKLITHTPADSDQEHLRVVMWADPTVPSRQDAVLANGTDPSPWLEAGVEHLVRCGAEIVVVPCNTVHKYLPAIMSGKPAEFISIIEATVRAVQRQTTNGTVGLLATDAALAIGMYQDALSSTGITPVLPATEEQALLMDIVRRVKAGSTGPELLQDMNALIGAMKSRGAKIAILGCTELSTLVSSSNEGFPLVLIDPAVELAKATVERATTRP